MNGSLDGHAVNSGFDPCFEPAHLRERSLPELWRAWRHVGRAVLARAWDETRVWRARSASRRTLRWLTERDLRDLGLTRQQALFEMNKPFWRA